VFELNGGGGLFFLDQFEGEGGAANDSRTEEDSITTTIAKTSSHFGTV